MTHAAEARRRRLARRVPDAAECASPGLERLLAEGEYRHPAPVAGGRTECLVLIDPRMRVTEATLRELAVRAAECGYVVQAARRVSGDAAARRELARAHYLPHAENASRGTLGALEQVRLLELYDRPEFETRFSVPAGAVEVVATERFMHEHDVPRAAIERWSRASTERHGLNSAALDGPNRLGDCLSVNVFQDARGRPYFLINPHMLEVLGAYEAAACLAVHLRARSAHALTLPRLRTELCGATDPARALPGSLRGDSLAGLFPLRGKDGTPVSRWNNGIHMSNGAVEAIRELRIWFGAERDRRPSAHTLMQHAWIDHGGRRRALAELASGMSPEEVVELIRGGRLLGPVPGTRDVARERRVTAAWAASKRLREDRDVLAVIVLGRDLREPEVELLAVTGAGRGDEVIGGVTVRRRSLAAVERRLTNGSSLGRLRAVARVGNGVVLWDPHGLAPGFAAANAALLPPLAVAESLLARAARGDLHHTLAVLLLSLHPLRYDHPRWAADDLRSIGEARLAGALLRAGDDPPHIAEALLARARARVDEVYATATALVAGAS